MKEEFEDGHVGIVKKKTIRAVSEIYFDQKISALRGRRKSV